MTGLSAADLAGIRTTVDTFLPDTCTNGRTHGTSSCRVDDAYRDQRLAGLPSFLRLRMWHVVMPDNTPVSAGDVLTVTGKGVYVVLTVMNPTSYSASTTVEAVLVTMSSDGSKLPVTPNATVTFTNPLAVGGVGSITAQVYLFPADKDVQLYGLEPAMKWGVMFDPTLAYSDGSLVEAGHEIRSAASLGTKADGVTPRKAALSSPRRTIGMLAMATAYFREPA